MFRDRIKDFRRVPASDLRPNPKNWRTHPPAQQDALRGVLAEVGVADAVLARELEDGSLMLIDGHLRAETLAGSDVPVLVLDVNEEEADRLLLLFDPLSGLAGTDQVLLEALLRDVRTSSEPLSQMYEDLAADAGLVMVDREPRQSDSRSDGGESACLCPRCGGEAEVIEGAL